MFENAKTIQRNKNIQNSISVYFKDLNIIYPLHRAILNIRSDGEYKIFVGKDKVGEGNCPLLYDSYDITELVAESDFLYVCMLSDSETFTAQINLEFAGSLKGEIVTDESWLTCISPVAIKDIESGSIFDFAKISDFTGKVDLLKN